MQKLNASHESLAIRERKELFALPADEQRLVLSKEREATALNKRNTREVPRDMRR
ncbi:MAG: hypothetical protein QOF72_3094 [Blastocatellia bacterium]|jgi:hypothetical protein|nr:hypothetical protein [Blastocatellia bacterium]MDX6576250.1 hypothetical protein [Blastocatellia bacterium]